MGKVSVIIRHRICSCRKGMPCNPQRTKLGILSTTTLTTGKLIYTFQWHTRKWKVFTSMKWRLGRSLGHSYSRRGSGVLSPDTEYEFISTEKHLLPEGWYSWWGIDNEENSSESIYGTCKFSFSFPYMLQQFCHAHAH